MIGSAISTTNHLVSRSPTILLAVAWQTPVDWPGRRGRWNIAH